MKQLVATSGRGQVRGDVKIQCFLRQIDETIIYNRHMTGIREVGLTRLTGDV